MEINQKLELRKLLSPELRQSLNILALQSLDLGNLIEEEILNNPLLNDSERETPLKTDQSMDADEDYQQPGPTPPNTAEGQNNYDLLANTLTQKDSLSDILFRQLGMFTSTDEELAIGQEIITNIDENGYLKVSLEVISNTLQISLEKIEKVLKLIQQFEPAGVGARTIAECLAIQLDLSNEKDPILRKLISGHLDDIAKKKYSLIAKALKEPEEKIASLIKKILKLNPKPGRNYSLDETHPIIPDVIIEEKEEKLTITINHEYIPRLTINKSYRDMLKKDNLDPKAKEFLRQKLRNALELIRAISKRQSTLRRVMEIIVEIQKDAITQDLALLKPLAFEEIATKLNLHESTISRVVMNKYAQTPCGVIALKSFFSNQLNSKDGQSFSSTYIKSLIKEFIDEEDKKHPLSDDNIAKRLLNEKRLEVSRRTVTKYREELKLASSPFRKER